MALKKWLKRTATAVAVSLIARTAWLAGDREWRRAEGERALAAAVAQTEAEDPAWAWESLAAGRLVPPPGRNGADIIPLVKSLTPPDWHRPENPDAWAPGLPTLPPNHALPRETIAAARRALEPARRAVDLARTLKDFPDGNRVIALAPDVLSTRLQDTQDTRLVATLLRWDAALAATDSDTGRAADDLLAMLNASRSVGDEPFLISQLVRIAARAIAARTAEWVLGQIELPAPRLEALQAAWAADAEEPLLLNGLRGERAAYDVLLRNLADGTVTPDSIAGRQTAGASFGGYAWWLYRRRFPQERAFYHRHLTLAVDAARLPAHEQADALGSLPRPDEGMRFAALLLPAAEKVGVAHRRSVAEARCLSVALACERFRMKEARWPSGLEELAPDLLGKVPLDPFDGQPVRYKKLADGVVVHSVGKDGSDDGGDTSHAGNPAGKDDGVRLWSPEHRRAGLREGERVPGGPL